MPARRMVPVRFEASLKAHQVNLLMALACFQVLHCDAFTASLPSSAGICADSNLKSLQSRSSCPASPTHSLKTSGLGAGALIMDTEGWGKPTARGKKDLMISANAVSTRPVAPKHDDGCSLSQYLKLPVDQLTLIRFPNNARLERIDAEHFALQVPDLKILNVGVRPYVVAKMRQTDEGWVVEATESRIEQSGQRSHGFDLNSMSSFSIKVLLQGQHDRRGLRHRLQARSEIRVWVDPPGVLRAMVPTAVMSESGSAVLQASLDLLQRTFLQGLAADYDRWARDPAYRQQCAAKYSSRQ